MNETIKTVGLFLGLSVALALGTRGCNSLFNDRTINKPAYHTESRATGLYGHIEYTKYADGSQDVKIYPGFSHRWVGSELHQDLDGDGLIDRIRQDGPEIKMHSLYDILVRKEDYRSNKKRFDEADKQLQDLMVKYPQKSNFT